MSSIQAITRRLLTYCSHCKEKAYYASRHWRDADWLRGSSDLFTVMGATKRFVRREVPQLLGVPPNSPIHIELPVLGSQSLTLILTVAGKKVVLRVYPLSVRRTAEAHLNAANLLSSHGVNVPAILFSSLDAPADQVIFILEEFVEGTLRRFTDVTDNQTAAMATELAKMHSVQNTSWGRLNSERDTPFFPSMLQRAKRDLETLQHRSVLSEAEAAEVFKWTEQWEEKFNNYPVFSLTHNDLQPSNALFTAEDKYYLVDLNRLQWGPAAREVVQCYHRQFRNDPAKIAVFDESYYAGLEPEQARATREFCRFYQVFHRITALVKMDVKAEKIPELQARNAERQKVMVEELKALIREHRTETTNLDR